ncbi:MAG: branched-chain amino acid ABC transporter permease [Armatimonadota bacterium]|nr:branched-chain amino acid ABC transporter permease [Armatimonadota bacterium]
MSRTWLVRIGSIVGVGLLLYVFHTFVVGNLELLDNRLIVLSLLYAILAVSLNIINGITGQFSIGHAAFYQVGAYVTGYVAVTTYNPTAMPDWLWLIGMMILGGIAAGVAGLVVGLPSLRLRGDYLAIVTLGFGEIIRIIVQNVEKVGGSYGMTIKPANGEVIQITPVWMVLLLLIVVIAVSRNLLKTAHGLQFLSVREDELAASAMGVNTTKTKVTAFILGAAFAGMAGALFSHYEGFITPKNFFMDQSFLILAMVVIGGTGSITGAALSGIVLTLLPEALRDLPAIPAILLLAFVIAAIIVLMISGRLRPKLVLKEPSGTQKGFAVIGMLGLAAVAYGLYWIVGQDIPIVSKAGVILAGLGIVAAIALSKERLTSLASWGYFTALMGLMVALTFPIRMGFEALPFIADNLATTAYQAGNLRMPFFAVILVLIMLSRPQGVFGHREFSWSFFGKKQKEAVA